MCRQFLFRILVDYLLTAFVSHILQVFITSIYCHAIVAFHFLAVSILRADFQMGSKISLPQNFEKYRHGGVFSQIGAFKGEDFSNFKFQNTFQLFLRTYVTSYYHRNFNMRSFHFPLEHSFSCVFTMHPGNIPLGRQQIIQNFQEMKPRKLIQHLTQSLNLFVIF